jgi:hypothetical protein
MEAPITPQVHLDDPHKVVHYKTYRKLKADLKRLMKEYGTTSVTVYRSLRGEWGERYEHWHLHGNKLVLGKSGWS